MRGRRDINKFSQRLSFPIWLSGCSADTDTSSAFHPRLNICSVFFFLSKENPTELPNRLNDRANVYGYFLPLATRVIDIPYSFNISVYIFGLYTIRVSVVQNLHRRSQCGAFHRSCLVEMGPLNGMVMLSVLVQSYCQYPPSHTHTCTHTVGWLRLMVLLHRDVVFFFFFS